MRVDVPVSRPVAPAQLGLTPATGQAIQHELVLTPLGLLDRVRRGAGERLLDLAGQLVLGACQRLRLKLPREAETLGPELGGDLRGQAVEETAARGDTDGLRDRLGPSDDALALAPQCDGVAGLDVVLLHDRPQPRHLPVRADEQQAYAKSRIAMVA